MENLNYVMTVDCETPEVEKRYKELALRMLKDEAFFEKCKTCKNMEELYMAYKEFGYTDLEYPDFETQFTDLFSALPLTEEGIHELTTKDLEQVVGGGFGLFDAIMTALNFIPIVGPLVSGVAKGIKAGIEGEGACGVVLELAKGVGCALADTVGVLATGGATAVVKNLTYGGVGVIKAVVTNVNLS